MLQRSKIPILNLGGARKNAATMTDLGTDEEFPLFEISK
jgi:hypothetical protein